MALFLALTASAYAVPVGGLIWPNGTPTLLSDNSADFIINGIVDFDDQGLPIFGDPDIVEVGDILVTIVGINTIEGTSNKTIGSGTIYNELTAVSAVKIASLEDSQGNNFHFTNSQGLTMQSYSAEALTAADTWALDWATGDILGGALTFTTQPGISNDGEVFGILYEDIAKNYTRDGSLQSGLTSATDGAYRLLLGLVDGNGDYLEVLAPYDLAQLAFFTANPPPGHYSTDINFSNIALDGTILDQNWPGLNFFTNITGGNGGFSTPTASSDWPAFDNLDFTVQAQYVPEPSTIGLLGIGLLGAGICSRIRRKK